MELENDEETKAANSDNSLMRFEFINFVIRYVNQNHNTKHSDGLH